MLVQDLAEAVTDDADADWANVDADDGENTLFKQDFTDLYSPLPPSPPLLAFQDRLICDLYCICLRNLGISAQRTASHADLRGSHSPPAY